MQAIEAQQDSLSWSALRKRANQLGIPAWRLAEDMAFHELNERPRTDPRGRIFSQDH